MGYLRQVTARSQRSRRSHYLAACAYFQYFRETIETVGEEQAATPGQVALDLFTLVAQERTGKIQFSVGPPRLSER